MFEFLFKYSPTIFSRGQFVFLTPWPLWLMALGMLAAGAGLFWHMRKNRGFLTGTRPIVIWLLETALVALILFLLWHPALSVATLRPQQNVVTILIDDSRSMGIDEGGKTRSRQVEELLNSGLLDELKQRFQVRMYRFGKEVERIEKPEQLNASATATRIGDALNQVMSEASILPLGAVVLMSDGADNSGGIDLETIGRIRQQRVPVHTIGFGREKFARDVELVDVTLPARSLAESRLNARVTLRQSGYARQKARLSIRDGGKVLASQPFEFKGDGIDQTESVMFNSGPAGPRVLQVSVDPLPGEENSNNNALTRLVNVSARKPRILYIEGEPRWEYKFIRRGVEDDQNLDLVSMLRTSQNKIYRQNIGNPKELEDGFPAKAEELFAYDALIIGSVEANYFTPAQQEMIREFANRRGGGVLFLAGRFALSEGGYARSSLTELLPVRLPGTSNTFFRDQSMAELTVSGRDSVLTRLDENAQKNIERWKKMPLVANYQVVGEAKPGAVTLLDVNPPGKRRSPLLVVQNYGRGRSAVLASAGTWRWKMWMEHTDTTHKIFWDQLLRWLVSETPGQIAASTPRQVLPDENRVHLRVEARDKTFQPVSSAKVEAHVIGPGDLSVSIAMKPHPLEPGVYEADWTAERPGSYMTEIVASQDSASKGKGVSGELGRDVVMFRREDGVAESFHPAQNRELLESLSDRTGGRYYTARDGRKLATDISYSEAGITTHETRDLWDMPIIFLLALMLRSSEWLLRRKWGVV